MTTRLTSARLMERPPGAGGHDQANYCQPDKNPMRINPSGDVIRVHDLTVIGLTAPRSVASDQVHKRHAQHGKAGCGHKATIDPPSHRGM
jgi:hypothetical protein